MLRPARGCCQTYGMEAHELASVGIVFAAAIVFAVAYAIHCIGRSQHALCLQQQITHQVCWVVLLTGQMLLGSGQAPPHSHPKTPFTLLLTQAELPPEKTRPTLWVCVSAALPLPHFPHLMWVETHWFVCLKGAGCVVY